MTVVDVALNHATRTVRRYGVDLSLRRPLVLTLLGTALALVVTATAAAGYLAGQDRRTDPAAMEASSLVLVAGVAALVGLALVAAPARQLRAALYSLRSWQLLAGCGVSVRSFAWGRFLATEMLKASFLLAAVGSFVVAALLAEGAGGPTWVVGASVLLGCLATALGRALLVLRGAARRLDQAPGSGRWSRALLTVAVVLLLGTAVVTAWSGSTMGVAGVVAEAAQLLERHRWVALAASGGLAGLAATVLRQWDRALGEVSWAEVWDLILQGRTARISSPTLPEGRLRAVCAVDGRRLSRSRAERLRPALTVVGGLPLLLVIAAVGMALTGSEIAVPDDLPLTKLLAGVVAFVGYAVLIACASFLAMDADRHAFTLWQLTPDGVRIVARARAMQGAALTFVASAVATAAATVAFDLSAWQAWTCLVAGATMAVFGTVIDLVASLVWPELEWSSTTEIGTSSPGRYAASFVVGIPVVAAIALLSTVTSPVPTGAVVLSAVLMLVAAPLLAALLMSAVLTISGKRLHA